MRLFCDDSWVRLSRRNQQLLETPAAAAVFYMKLRRTLLLIFASLVFYQ